jgi:hypothetical protein
MNDLLPSRNVIAFVLVPVVTVVAVWALFFVEWETSDNEEKSIETLSVAIQEGNLAFQNLDSDNDGLKDWEEFLYETDPENPDTDGDGANDGNEVQRGFDPLISGNGTSSVDVEKQSDFNFYKNDTTLSRTDVLSRDTFSAYLNLRKADALGQELLVAKTLEKAIEENTFAESAIIYNQSDIKTVTPTTSTRRVYFEQYRRATLPLSAIRFDEIELLARFLYQQDQDALLEINKNAALYQGFLTALENMAVPSDVAGIHVELMNNFSIILNSLENMILVEADPLTALVYSEKLSQDQDILINNTRALALYFDTNGL